MKHDDPRAKKYKRYLQRYVGEYRVKAYYDTSTNDFPKDKNDESKVDEDFEDLYIPCKRGIYKHAYCDILCWYNDKVSQGRNVLKEVQEKYPDIILDYEETSGDFMIYFHSQYIKQMSEIVYPLTGGATIKPFSVKNLPKPVYTIPDIDNDKLKSMLNEFDNVEKRLLIMKSVRSFDNIIQNKFTYKKKNKTIKYDVKSERKKTLLKPKVFIHYLGMWDEFLEHTQNIINDYKNTGLIFQNDNNEE